MPLPDVAIFHDSQSRNAAPPQWSALRTRGCSRTRLPSPSGTTNIMTPMPVVTPSRQGRPLRTPACAPAAVSMMLLGPGVTAATTAKRRNATICSVVVRYPRYDLARQFRIMLGTSPYRYLLMRRLEFAREQIHRERPLVEVAFDAGFADQAHFTRAFRSAFGLTPARYRALRASQSPPPTASGIGVETPHREKPRSS